MPPPCPSPASGGGDTGADHAPPRSRAAGGGIVMVHPPGRRGGGGGGCSRPAGGGGEGELTGAGWGEGGDVAAGMAAGAAEIKARQVRAVIAGARERAVIADLVVGERADEEIAVAHVGEIARDVERRAHKRIDDRVGEVGRVLLPELE